MFGTAFANIMLTEIIPMVDSTYRTLPDRDHRAMAGLSMGGMQTFQITLNNLDKFSYIGGFSSAGGQFPDFKTALDFVNRVGAIAETEGHHPDLCLAWGRVDAITYTHKIKGLTESDFVLAAKMDRAYLEKTPSL